MFLIVLLCSIFLLLGYGAHDGYSDSGLIAMVGFLMILALAVFANGFYSGLHHGP